MIVDSGSVIPDLIRDRNDNIELFLKKLQFVIL